MSRRGVQGISLLLWASMIGLASADTGQHSLSRIRIATDGRSFETSDGTPFVPIGVNYFRPGTGWAPQVWKQFDPAATQADFQRMKELGVNCVRVFLSFGSFFMHETKLEPAGLEKFDQFLRIAESHGIYVHPTGPDHWEGLPDWARRDRVADERVLKGLESFWSGFARRYRDRNVIFAYDLRNEPSVPWDTPALRSKWNKWLERHYGNSENLARAWHVDGGKLVWGHLGPPAAQNALHSQQLIDYQRFREGVADQWTRRQTQAIKAAAPESLVTVGLIQWSVPTRLSGVQHYSAFRPQRQAALCDFLSIHFYPLANGFYDYRSPADEWANLAYLESVVREVAMAGKPTVIGEFGWYGGGQLTFNPKLPPADQDQQARWCRLVVDTTRPLATGWFNWGLYDHPQARDVTQLTGLLTVDGQPKAWARAFQLLARRLTTEPTALTPLAPRPKLDWDAAVTDINSTRQFRNEYLQAFRNDVTFD